MRKKLNKKHLVKTSITGVKMTIRGMAITLSRYQPLTVLSSRCSWVSMQNKHEFRKSSCYKRYRGDAEFKFGHISKTSGIYCLNDRFEYSIYCSASCGTYLVQLLMEIRNYTSNRNKYGTYPAYVFDKTFVASMNWIYVCIIGVVMDVVLEYFHPLNC